MINDLLKKLLKLAIGVILIAAGVFGVVRDCTRREPPPPTLNDASNTP